MPLRMKHMALRQKAEILGAYKKCLSSSLAAQNDHFMPTTYNLLPVSI